MRIGIIGGAGRMGGWFARFFAHEGYDVLIADPVSPGTLTNAQVIESSDVVLFALPLRETAKVIEKLAPLGRKNQLWMDVTSIKREAVKAALLSKAEVLSIHPMFAPTFPSMHGQTVIVSPARVSEEKQAWFMGLLKKHNAKIKIADADTHDRWMATIQGFTHFSAITAAKTLRDSGFDIAESLQFTSQVYRLRIALIARVMQQNPELYADIQLENDLLPEILDHYLEASEELYHIVRTYDREAFIEYFKEAGEYFTESLKNKKGGDAFEETNALVQLLADLTDDNTVRIQAAADRAGLLQDLLTVFSKHNISLTSIHSIRTTQDGFAFHIGLDRSNTDPEIKKVKDELSQQFGVSFLA